jgi:GNAT superfamily N-acetyltransferase
MADFNISSNHIERLQSFNPADLDELSELLIDCVGNGASISFMWPLSKERALAFWQGVAVSAARGERIVLAARDSRGRIVGTVQAITAMPDNQPHRADIAKMLVHSGVRRQGVGEALMRAVEGYAAAGGKTLLCLDTATGSAADRLYTRLGWQRVGEIPHYALMPDGAPCPTTFFYKFVA